MSDGPTIITSEADTFEYWTQTGVHRWVRPADTSTDPDVLQVAWQSSRGRIEWRRVELVIVSRDTYEAEAS